MKFKIIKPTWAGWKQAPWLSLQSEAVVYFRQKTNKCPGIHGHKKSKFFDSQLFTHIYTLIFLKCKKEQ
ncbi:hypothetical protein DDR33_21730 [Pararcticibacter amylolyticus]|uniref:Uncharacterized protein n=1 Tax=Pararcticibacter amylolyticus TaxID=2173175 RepID=A0A2U2PB07_9SPHI|nr:hypothetical protein DDR33_21730 [Pararcticibacter amylolyticus]